MKNEPFSHHHIPDAALLLAQQNSQLLNHFPLLPAAIADPAVTLAFLQAVLEKGESHGSVLYENSQLSAFMLGYYDESPFFGRHCWVPFGGTACAQPEPYQTLRELYAAASQRWVQDEVLNHYLVFPASSQWLEASYSLSFGQEQLYAVTSLAQQRPDIPLPQGLKLREVQPTDASQLFERGHWIAAHLNHSPVWEPVPQEHLDMILPQYAQLANDDDTTTWVVLDQDQIVAFVVLFTVDLGAIHLLGVPEAAEFAAAAVHPDYRQRGIGKALFNHIINVARAQNYAIMFTDWRTTNLQAASYWPTFGFQPFAYRLLRRVNPRYKPYQHSAKK